MEVNETNKPKQKTKSYSVKKNFTYKDKDYRFANGDKIKLNDKQAKVAKKQNLI